MLPSEVCERGLEVWFRMRSSIGVLCPSDHTKFGVPVLCSSELGLLCRMCTAPVECLLSQVFSFTYNDLGSLLLLKEWSTAFQKAAAGSSGSNM